MNSTTKTSRRLITLKRDESTADNQTIQRTTNYDQFQFLGANRETNRGHIEALKKAFEEQGNLSAVQPILVNENYEIIDGQHRFVACQELGAPIYYTLVPGLRVGDARAINVLHKGWTAEDYARSYAVTGDNNYRKYLQMREDYGFSHSITMLYILGQEDKGQFKEFRAGNFVVPNEREARERLDKLVDTAEFVPMVREKTFAVAFLKALQVSGYDHKRMLSKLQSAQHLLRRFGSTTEYLKMLEDVYNYNTREGSRVRLY